VLEALEARFRERTTQEWLADLRGVVPVAPVRSLDAALDPAELEGRGMLAEYEHAALGRVRSVATPLHLGGYAPDYRPGPLLGADTDALLAELGYDAGEVAELRASGAFGDRVEREVAAGEP
jgi:crotonobetainyl-CoA:carnitine CoA-transferase CaiB-like acyl-CoA transferase